MDTLREDAGIRDSFLTHTGQETLQLDSRGAPNLTMSDTLSDVDSTITMDSRPHPVTLREKRLSKRVIRSSDRHSCCETLYNPSV